MRLWRLALRRPTLRSLYEGGGGSKIVLAARYLSVALIGVGIVLVPGYANAPVMTPAQKHEFVVAKMPPKDYARYLLEQEHPDPRKQFGCLAQLWGKESAWNYQAKSPTHDYGIPQRHMKHNTAKEIYQFMKHPHTQIRWGLGYIAHRYKSPCGALAAWISRSNNGKGGWY